MADNVAYNPSGATLFATKDDGTAHHQKSIIEGQNLAGTAIGLGKAEDEAHSTGDGGIMALVVRKDAVTALAGTDGDYIPLIVDASGRLWTNPSGVTQPISGTVTASNAAGDVAHDTGDSGNPVKVGSKAVSLGSTPTAVTANDRANLLSNLHGVPFVLGGGPNIVTTRYNTTGSQTDVSIVTVAGGTKIVVTQIQVIADNANTASPAVTVGFAAATTPTGDGVLISHPGIPGGGGTSRGDGSGIVGAGADGEDIRITCGAPTGGSLTVMISYFLIAG